MGVMSLPYGDPATGACSGGMNATERRAVVDAGVVGEERGDLLGLALVGAAGVVVGEGRAVFEGASSSTPRAFPAATPPR
jgi:hypothetical protein